MAASRALRVRTPFPRSRSRCSRELENGRYVEMTDLERAGPDAVFVRREDDQQLEAQGITFNGMPARAPVAWKILPQEHRQGRSEFNHRSSSSHAASRLPATPVAATPASLPGTSKCRRCWNGRDRSTASAYGGRYPAARPRACFRAREPRTRVEGHEERDPGSPGPARSPTRRASLTKTVER